MSLSLLLSPCPPPLQLIHCSILQCDESDPFVIKHLRECILNKRTCCVRLCNKTKGGALFWNFIYLAPATSPRGRELCTGVQLDITSLVADCEFDSSQDPLPNIFELKDRADVVSLGQGSSSSISDEAEREAAAVFDLPHFFNEASHALMEQASVLETETSCDLLNMLPDDLFRTCYADMPLRTVLAHRSACRRFYRVLPLAVKCIDLRGPDFTNARIIEEQTLTPSRDSDLLGRPLTDIGTHILASLLQQCTSLESLDISQDNQIGTPGFTALGNALQLCPRLTSLDIGGNFINKEGATGLVPALQKCTTLRRLTARSFRLSHSSIEAEGAAVLCVALSKCPELERLDLGCDIGPLGATALAGTLSHCTLMRTLELSRAHIGNEGAAALSSSLLKCRHLTRLDLSDNSLTEAGATAIGTGLSHAQNLAELRFDFNRIEAEGAAALGTGLSRFAQCTSLTNLNLCANDVGAEGLAALLGSLRCCSSIASLKFGDNDLCDEGAVILAESLHHFPNLLVLDLNTNNIESGGIAALALALPKCPLLKDFDLTHIDLGDEHNEDDTGREAAALLGDALSQLTMLERLSLDYASFCDAGFAALVSALPGCSSLKHLEMLCTQAGINGRCAGLSRALAQCKSLVQLDLEENSIDNEGAVLLAAAFPLCTSLKQIHMAENAYTESGASALSTVLGRCPAIRIFGKFGGGGGGASAAWSNPTEVTPL